MADDPPTIGEELAAALIVQLLRKDVIDAGDIEAMSEDLSEDARHLASALIVEAAAPKESDWRAEKARKRFRVVKD